MGCTPSLKVSKVNTTRVPEYLLAPIPHPVVGDTICTVEDLLLIIRQYDDKLEVANDRFEEIRFIQAANEEAVVRTVSDD